MHPIERLRFVARATGYPADVIVAEAARALASFSDDPHGLVTACRRLVSRQPGSAPLVWLCARVLCASDARKEIRRVLVELDEDTTAASLSHSLPDGATVVVLGWPELVSESLPRRGDVEVLVIDTLGEGSGLVRRLLEADVDAVDVPLAGLGAAVAEADLVLLEASAVAPTEFMAVSGSRAAAAVARHAAIPVWSVAGVGRFLPERMWTPMRAAVLSDDPWDIDDEMVPLDLIDAIVGPAGVQTVAEALRRTDCPVAPELFKGNIL
jgi:translation initiation factor 2B subunit (eIF-2B alpha/beta/delta family)